jgi:hypothetical protein
MEVQEDQLEYEFAVNVFGVIYMTQAVVGVGQMPQGGRIVNIGSIASKVLVPPPVYGATKAASDALTTLWAAEVSFPVFFHSTLNIQLTNCCTAWQEPWYHCQYTRPRSRSNRHVERVLGGA